MLASSFSSTYLTRWFSCLCFWSALFCISTRRLTSHQNEQYDTRSSCCSLSHPGVWRPFCLSFLQYRKIRLRAAPSHAAPREPVLLPRCGISRWAQFHCLEVGSFSPWLDSHFKSPPAEADLRSWSKGDTNRQVYTLISCRFRKEKKHHENLHERKQLKTVASLSMKSSRWMEEKVDVDLSVRTEQSVCQFVAVRIHRWWWQTPS